MLIIKGNGKEKELDRKNKAQVKVGEESVLVVLVILLYGDDYYTTAN